MRRFPVLFLAFGILVILSTSSHAQRGIGAQSLVLDDGFGHTVTISIPHMTGVGAPYSWTLPITPGGSALLLPTPTTPNSTLYSNGTNSWLENTSLLMPSAGALSASSSAGGAGTALSLTAGSSGGANDGANASLS